ncbi:MULTISPECIES: xanthine dehydrogenase family protein subunit M [unclassified Bradyrhizobium]|uniref:FAD binding domain-containing protein n=1 Tax=unclassified Bradyrhizobium TaxID=2631580 RepID=UPI0015CA25CD|nr:MULTISPECIES: xanthine dehydrogenase family protein subunit M [unclassified Bradyrhizobium]MBB4260561.1 carbon-monoxide dehydrogenase medium subunit [Bradyrhizobium sp. CIR3A]NYG46831.1 carbon-monoxide dehydrogenase medium subunit [Bradyrhizobium sp. IAR9]
MKPPPFEYLAVDSVQAATAALAEANGDGKLLAGGQSLLPMLNFRLLRPSVLIDINRISDLSYIRDEGGHIRIGALTRHRIVEVSDLVATHLPVLSEAMGYVAHLAIRNRGTIGGSLSHADPAAELPMMSMLLDAELELASAEGSRTVKAADFFVGALTTDLAEGEMLVSVSFPKCRAGVGYAFEEVARRSGDFALACVAICLERDGDRISSARVGMMGVGETPMRASEAEALLVSRPFDDALVSDAVSAIRIAVEPNTDLHASADYRRHLVGVLAERAIRRAWSRATEASHG